MRVTSGVSLLIAAVVLAAPAIAEGPIAEVHLNVERVEWSPRAEFAGLRLTVSTPQGVQQLEFAPGESPVFELAATAAGDGIYTWELLATPQLGEEVRAAVSGLRTGSGGGGESRPPALPPSERLIQGGSFLVAAGAIVQPADEPGSELKLDVRRPGTEAAIAPLERATAEFNVSDNLFVHSSACVGFDCVFGGETFGFDTIRMKENNTQIHFDDTSTASGFPNRDWRLIANDSNSGGRNVFFLQDATVSREVFSVEGNARQFALYVDDAGRVGLGTSTPVLNLHVVSGNTPALRLDQNTSSGFAAQVWDMAGNETSFFIRNVTGGSTLPFRIFPGAASSSLIVAANSNVGVGTLSPNAKLHVLDTAGGAGTADVLLLLENNGPPRFDQTDSNAGVTFRQTVGLSGATRFYRVIDTADATVELELNGDGDLTIAGDLTANGMNYPSSRAWKDAIAAVDSREILERLVDLPVTVWSYKADADGHRHIGTFSEDFHAAFDFLPDGPTLNTIDMHGVTMAAIQGLSQVVDEKDRQIVALQDRLAKLEAALGEREEQ